MKDIAALPKNYTRLIGEHIDNLRNDPRPPGTRKLVGSTEYRLRVGVYRILYDVDDGAHVVTVYRVRHRREAYR